MRRSVIDLIRGSDTMRPIISSRALLIFALSSVFPVSALAQSRHAIAFHVGRNDALPTEATLGGLSYTSWAGMLGVREESLTSPRGEWFERRMVAARRIVEGGRPLVRPSDEVDQEPDALDPPDKAPPPAR